MNTAKLDSEREATKTPEDSLAVWKREIEAAKTHYEKFWKTADDQLKRYRDERDADVNDSGAVARLNFFWSNVQVLKSTLYVKPPKVDVSRLFKDYQDDVARVAGVMMERLLNHDLERDNSDFDVAVRNAIDDWLIVGQGQVWYRYEVTTEQVPIAPPVEMMPPQVDIEQEPGKLEIEVEQTEAQEFEERIVDESALSDYVYWKDFLTSPARTWDEVRWVGRRVYMTRDALVDRFGQEIGNAVSLATRTIGGTATRDSAEAEDNPWATAEVWEIWCKTNRKVYWIATGYDRFLDSRDDPLKLENFFPCPEPMLANKTNNTLVPRSDYSMARDQYRQIDTLVARLRMLIDACKVRGAYDKESAGALANILAGPDNKMVPVENWALFGERGGLKGVMDWVPIEQIVTVVQQLRQDLAEQKQQLYETLGLSDIMRGATRASETATAQQIKAQFGSTRLQFKQFETARFVRDAQRIKAEIISRHYQPQTIISRSNIDRTPDAQLAPQAVQLLKDQTMAEFRISVESDSMAALDWANERDARTQFLTAIGGFVQSMTPLAQAQPGAVPVMLQLMQWGLAGFRVGKEIEGVIDQAIQQMQQQPTGPSPEQKAKEQAEIRKTVSEGDKNEAQAQKARAEAGGEVVDMQSKRIETVQRAMVPTPMDQLRPEELEAMAGELQKILRGDAQSELEALVRAVPPAPTPAPIAPKVAPPDPRILHRLYPEGVKRKMGDRQKELDAVLKELRK